MQNKDFYIVNVFKEKFIKIHTSVSFFSTYVMCRRTANNYTANKQEEASEVDLTN